MNLRSPFRLAPVPVYLIMIGAASFFGMTGNILASVYRIEEAGLNPLQLVLVGTVLEASVFLFEIPTGVVADVYSRRASIIVGFLMIGAGYIVEGTFPTFATILAAQVIWGVGYTFTSGAQQAWLSDEIGGQGVGRIFLRGSQAGQVGALVGIGSGVALGTIGLGLPLIVAGALMIGLALFVTLVMPEAGFRRTPGDERETWQAMRQTFIGGVGAIRLRPALAVIVAVTVIYGAASEPIDRLWPIHLLTNFEFPSIGGFDTVVWFGVIGIASLLIGIAVTEVVRRRFDVDAPRTAIRLLAVMNFVHVVSIAVIALAGSFALAVSVFLASRVIRGVTDPVLDAWTNQYVDSKIRATVFSMRGQGDALGQIVFGPAMGALATLATIRSALMGVAALLLVAQPLYVFSGRRERDRESRA